MTGAIPELASEASAVLVETERPEALARGIVKLSTDPRRRAELGAAAAARAREMDVGIWAPKLALLALVGVGVIVFAPIAEETFWRGFIFKAMRRTQAAGSAIVWSGFLFGIVHLTAAPSLELLGQYVFTLAVPIGVLGCLLASLTERRGTIVPAIIAHASFNTFGFMMLVRQMG
jgi:membrane protease YdiL (CAAX protease family)